MKRPRLTFGISIIIIGGFVLLGIGLDHICGEPIQKLKSQIEEAKNTSYRYSIGKPLAYEMTGTYLEDTLPAKSVMLYIENNTIFDGDIIKIKMEAKDVNDDVIGFTFILNDGSWTLNNKTKKEIAFEQDYAGRHNTLLDLIRFSNPPFSAETSPKFSKPDVTYHVTGAILYNNGSYGTIDTSDGLFTIYPLTDKLQVSTNQAILKQIDQTEISNLQQDITNELFLGLSIIGVALIPIIGGFDFLFRIHLD